MPPEELERVAGGDSEPTSDQLRRRLRDLAAENRRLFERVELGERRFRRLARAVWKVQEEEHRRLARELHDGLGQLLVALKGRIDLLREAADDRLGSLQSELEECSRMTADALEQTRELSRLLRPAVLDDLGLVAALRWLARTLGERTGLEVELDVEDCEERFSPEIETVVFRVAQEGLTNVLKHSGERAADLLLERRDDSLRLCVRDQGRGFEPAQVLAQSEEGGLGLRAIQDRVDLLGGTLSLRAAPDEGTELEIHVPLRADLGEAQ